MNSFWRWSIALRYLRASASDQLVSFMSVISVSGLMLGVAVLVLVLSVMNGFERELRNRVLGVLPQAVIYRDGGFADWQAAADQWRDVPGLVEAAPYAEGSGLVIANEKVAGVAFYGVLPEAEQKVSILGDFVTAGQLDALEAGSFRAAVGATLAATLGVGLGDRFTLVLPDAQLTLAGPLPRTRRFEVGAIFRVGSDADKNQILVHLDDASRLTRSVRVEAIRLRLADLFDAPEVVTAIMTRDDSGLLHGSTWMRRYGNLYSAIQVQKSTMFLLLLMLVAVAAFNVVSNLVMTVDEKRSDIAILRTLGATPQAILVVFMIHGALVGLMGITLGLVAGVVLAVNLGPIYTTLDQSLGLGLMDEYFIHYLPSEVIASDVALIGFVSLLICLVATLYPAFKAANSHPVEALSYDG